MTAEKYQYQRTRRDKVTEVTSVAVTVRQREVRGELSNRGDGGVLHFIHSVA